ncbi:MAG TPA: SH3 domain-containing protein, partial [Acidobacteriaceae bacterium]|nr:SH3 domain-containing protein [Acidobacteriaceae bacterium]
MAPVSNHTGQVINGERLQVLDHMHRFVKVKTEQGAVGWIEEPAVIDQTTYDSFIALQKQHARDQVVAHAILRDD